MPHVNYKLAETHLNLTQKHNPGTNKDERVPSIVLSTHKVAHDVRVNLIEEAVADSSHNWASSKRTSPLYNWVHLSIQGYEAKGGVEPNNQGDVICTNNKKPIPVETVALLSADPFLYTYKHHST